MNRRASLRIPALLAVLSLPACAQSSPTGTPPSAPEAAIPVASSPAASSLSDDELARRLHTWLQLIALPADPAIPARTYADFLKTGAAWPRQKTIELRYQAALARETDNTEVAALCQEHAPATAAALSRCVSASGTTPALLSAARTLWRSGADTAQDAATVRSLFPDVVTAVDTEARFAREERTGQLTAARQTLSLLPAQDQPLATAKLAFRQNSADAESTLSAVPAAQSRDPELFLLYARWLRKADRTDDALTRWTTTGFALEETLPASERPAFLTERDSLARTLLTAGRAHDAFTVACDTAQSDERHRLNAAFLPGWILLRQLHNPSASEQFFRKLADSSAFTLRAQGLYWLGRAHEEMGNSASATADWQRAAELPQTFYGQMAIAELSHAGATLLSPAAIPPDLKAALARWRLRSQAAPSVSADASARIGATQAAHAARILVSWNDSSHARDFLTQLLNQQKLPAGQEATGALGRSLGLPDIGVAVYRMAGRRGILLPAETGWPQPWPEPQTDMPPGFVSALIRQESNFNPDAVSSSGAVGLMQMLPGTARDMARATGAGSVAGDALRNPTLNIRLGSAYLDRIYRKNGGVVPYTAAGYNAGPHRVSQWLESGGDPFRSGADQRTLIDWIEQIPYTETRGYVKRVWEGIAVYAAQIPV